MEMSSRPADDYPTFRRAAAHIVCDARAFRGFDSHVRVTVRVPADNDRLLDALGV